MRVRAVVHEFFAVLLGGVEARDAWRRMWRWTARKLGGVARLAASGKRKRGLPWPSKLSMSRVRLTPKKSVMRESASVGVHRCPAKCTFLLHSNLEEESDE